MTPPQKAAKSSRKKPADKSQSVTPSLSNSSESCESSQNQLLATSEMSNDSMSGSPGEPSYSAPLAVDSVSAYFPSEQFLGVACVTPVGPPPISPDAHTALPSNFAVKLLSPSSKPVAPIPKPPAPLKHIGHLPDALGSMPLTPLTAKMSHLAVGLLPSSPVAGAGTTRYTIGAGGMKAEPPNLTLPQHVPYSPKPKVPRQPTSKKAGTSPPNNTTVVLPTSAILASAAAIGTVPSPMLRAMKPPLAFLEKPPAPAPSTLADSSAGNMSNSHGGLNGTGSSSSFFNNLNHLKKLFPELGSRPFVVRHFAFPTLKSGKIGLRIANSNGSIVASALMKVPRQCSGAPLFMGDVVLGINGVPLGPDIDASAPLIYEHAKHYDECIVSVAHFAENTTVMIPSGHVDM